MQHGIWQCRLCAFRYYDKFVGLVQGQYFAAISLLIVFFVVRLRSARLTNLFSLADFRSISRLHDDLLCMIYLVLLSYPASLRSGFAQNCALCGDFACSHVHFSRALFTESRVPKYPLLVT